MVKLFKCPNCDDIVDYVNKQTFTKINSKMHLDDRGDVHVVGSCIYPPDLQEVYMCPQCGYSSTSMSEFIKDINSECEHNETYGADHDEFEYTICYECGLITLIECGDGKDYEFNII